MRLPRRPPPEPRPRPPLPLFARLPEPAAAPGPAETPGPVARPARRAGRRGAAPGPWAAEALPSPRRDRRGPGPASRPRQPRRWGPPASTPPPLGRCPNAPRSYRRRCRGRLNLADLPLPAKPAFRSGLGGGVGGWVSGGGGLGCGGWWGGGCRVVER